MNSIDSGQFLASCCNIAMEAGKLILAHDQSNIAVLHKEDKSPVTAADHEANQYITDKLSKLTPDIPVVAEEDIEKLKNPPPRFWLVDPLDGTRGFAEGDKEYTVNIALIENHLPVLGVIYCPALGILYYGIPKKGAYRSLGGKAPELISVSTDNSKDLRVVKSKAHMSARMEKYLEKFPVKSVLPIGSSIKFCYVADGSADFYPRFGTTMEWDTAAGHAILKAAGGHVESMDGGELIYGKKDYINPGFIAYGKTRP